MPIGTPGSGGRMRDPDAPVKAAITLMVIAGLLITLATAGLAYTIVVITVIYFAYGWLLDCYS